MSLLGPKYKSFHIKTSFLHKKLFLALTSFVIFKGSDQVKDMIRKMKLAVKQFLKDSENVAPNSILIFEQRGETITIDFSFMIKKRIPRQKAKDSFKVLIDRLEEIKEEYLE